MINIEEVYDYLNEHDPEIASSICYASEMLLSQIDRAIESLRSRRVEAANNDEDEEYNRLTTYRDKLKEYKQDINAYLNYTIKKNTYTVEKEPHISELEHRVSDNAKDVQNKKHIDYSQYSVDNTKPHTLDENYTHTKICGFMYKSQKVQVKNWQDAIVTLCNRLAKQHPDKFDSLVDNPRFKGRKVSYFSYESVKGKNVKIYGTEVYVWINLNANDIAKNIADVLSEFGEQPKDFYVYLRADYSELHYGEQEKPQERINSGEEKIGKHVIKCMRELEQKHYQFSQDSLIDLLDVQRSKAIFGITYPFFVESSNMIYDQNGRGRYWKEPFQFNGKSYYITSQWYERNRINFDKWYKLLTECEE